MIEGHKIEKNIKVLQTLSLAWYKLRYIIYLVLRYYVISMIIL